MYRKSNTFGIGPANTPSILQADACTQVLRKAANVPEPWSDRDDRGDQGIGR